MIGNVWWDDPPTDARPLGMTPTYEDDDPIYAPTARGCLGMLLGFLVLALAAAWWFR